MQKLIGQAPAFCVAAGGLSLLLVTNVNWATAGALLLIAALHFSVCRCLSFSTPRMITALHAAVSAALSVYFSAKLPAESGVMLSSFYPLLALLVLAFAAAVAGSRGETLPRLCFVLSLLCGGVLLVLLFLCLLRTDFTLPRLCAPQPGALAVLTVISVTDLTLVFSFFDSPRVSGLAPHGYCAAMTLAAVSVLSPPLFENAPTPWLTLWSATYIPSFLNSFEIVGVCAFFALAAMRAGLLLHCCFAAGGRLLWLLAVAAAVIAFSLFSFTVNVALILCLALGIFSFFWARKKPAGKSRGQSRKL